MVRGQVDDDAFRLTEHGADLLAAVAFAILGMALIAPVVARATPATILYAVLSLTAVRIAPVAIAMVGSGFAWRTTAYIGWFGPRGLASIVFAGIVAESGIPGSSAVVDVVLLTIALSIVAHGMTAAWGARRYAAWFEAAAAADPAIAEAAVAATGGVQAHPPRSTTLVEHAAG
jgi:NhaP-type Na+/H+ or K+/H+ antiporter